MPNRILAFGSVCPFCTIFPPAPKELDEILDVAAAYNMVVSFHSSTSVFDDMIKNALTLPL